MRYCQVNITLYYYTAADHLGSICQLIESDGIVVKETNYDPWGRVRAPQTWQYDQSARLTLLPRGYTGHEMLREFGLINMNGRVYDPPLTSRFLSPDNYVQNPNNPQNYNRYTYALNNPLKYVDPDGELAWFVPVIIGAVIFGYLGGSAANNGELDPTEWDWSSGDTWAGIGIGMVVGAAAGYGFYALGSALAGTGFFSYFGASGYVTAHALAGGITGFGAGYLTGFGTAMVVSGGDWDYSHKVGMAYGTVGAEIGTFAGTIYGISTYQQQSYKENDYRIEIPEYRPYNNQSNSFDDYDYSLTAGTGMGFYRNTSFQTYNDVRFVKAGNYVVFTRNGDIFYPSFNAHFGYRGEPLIMYHIPYDGVYYQVDLRLERTSSILSFSIIKNQREPNRGYLAIKK